MSKYSIIDDEFVQNVKDFTEKMKPKETPERKPTNAEIAYAEKTARISLAEACAVPVLVIEVIQQCLKTYDDAAARAREVLESRAIRQAEEKQDSLLIPDAELMYDSGLTTEQVADQLGISEMRASSINASFYKTTVVGVEKDYYARHQPVELTELEKRLGEPLVRTIDGKTIEFGRIAYETVEDEKAIRTLADAAVASGYDSAVHDKFIPQLCEMATAGKTHVEQAAALAIPVEVVTHMSFLRKMKQCVQFAPEARAVHMFKDGKSLDTIAGLTGLSEEDVEAEIQAFIRRIETLGDRDVDRITILTTKELKAYLKDSDKRDFIKNITKFFPRTMKNHLLTAGDLLTYISAEGQAEVSLESLMPTSPIIDSIHERSHVAAEMLAVSAWRRAVRYMKKYGYKYKLKKVAKTEEDIETGIGDEQNDRL